MSIELVGDELGGVEDHPEPSQGFAHIPVSGGEFIQGQGLGRYGFFRPVQGEALQCSGIEFGLNEFWKRVRMMRPATPEKLI